MIFIPIFSQCVFLKFPPAEAGDITPPLADNAARPAWLLYKQIGIEIPDNLIFRIEHFIPFSLQPADPDRRSSGYHLNDLMFGGWSGS